MKLLSTSLLLVALLGSASSMAQSAPTQTLDGVLAGPSGMTLYVFDRDTAHSGKSACTGGCATNWPALKATDADKASGDYAVITRDDGQKQWTLKGQPLYYWAKDTKPGDKTGDGMLSGAWHAAKP